MTRKQKRTLVRILAAAVLLIAASLIPQQIFLTPTWVIEFSTPGQPTVFPDSWAFTGGTVSSIPRLLLFLVPYFVIGWDILWKAVRNIAHGQVFDENFLMCIATIGALVLGEYAEAVGVMLFYQVGELFQSYAVGRSRRSIAQLMDIRPDSANVERDGQIVQVDPDEVAVGEVIVVRPGEKVPLDGVVLEGSSALDTAALTGESAPRDVAPGGELLSGCVNLTGLLKVRVTKEFGQSTVAKILDLVENASSKKAKAENFITKFARYYTPAVVIGAVLLAVVLLILLPVPSVEAIFQGDIDWDRPELVSAVLEELDVGSLGFLESSNNILTQLQTALKEAGFGFDEFRKAQALYWLALSPFSEESDFIEKLVGCFAPEQANEELVANVNAAFGTDIDPE